MIMGGSKEKEWPRDMDDIEFNRWYSTGQLPEGFPPREELDDDY